MQISIVALAVITLMAAFTFSASVQAADWGKSIECTAVDSAKSEFKTLTLTLPAKLDGEGLVQTSLVVVPTKDPTPVTVPTFITKVEDLELDFMSKSGFACSLIKKAATDTKNITGNCGILLGAPNPPAVTCTQK